MALSMPKASSLALGDRKGCPYAACPANTAVEQTVLGSRLYRRSGALRHAQDRQQWRMYSRTVITSVAWLQVSGLTDKGALV